MDLDHENNGGDQKGKDIQSKPEENRTEYKSTFASNLSGFLNCKSSTEPGAGDLALKEDYERMKELLSEMKFSGWVIRAGNLSDESAREGIEVIKAYFGLLTENVHILAYVALRFEDYLTQASKDELRDELLSLFSESKDLEKAAQCKMKALREQLYADYVSDVLGLIKKHTQNGPEGGPIAKLTTEVWNDYLGNPELFKKIILKLNKSYKESFLPERIPSQIMLETFHKCDAQTALEVSKLFSFYPRDKSNGERLKEIISKRASDDASRISWWIVLTFVYGNSEHSELYKEPLKDITSLIFKIKGSLSFCDTNEMPFLIKKESVIDEKKPIYETRSEFRGSAVGWINEWIENNKRTLTYEDLKNIADFVPGEQVITTDIFDYPGHIGDARNLVTIGSLLDTSFSDPDRIDKDNFVKIVKTMLKKVKEEHQEQNFIAKFMFFPIFCPKFIKGHKDRLDVIYEYIKDLDFGSGDLLNEEFIDLVKKKEKIVFQQKYSLDGVLTFMDGFAYNIINSKGSKTEILDVLIDVFCEIEEDFLFKIMLFKATSDYFNNNGFPTLKILGKEAFSYMIYLRENNVAESLDRARIMFVSSFDKLANRLKENLVEMFNGEIGVDQAISLQEKEKYIKDYWKRLENISFCNFRIGPCRLLPRLDAVSEIGNMLKEIFDKLKEKDAELDYCSKWLETQGFNTKSSQTFFDVITLNTAETLFNEKMSEIYNYNGKKCEDGEIVDMYEVSHLVKVKSEIFAETFDKEKTGLLRESVSKTLKRVRSLVDIDNLPISELEGTNWIEFDDEKLAEEVNKLTNLYIENNISDFSFEAIVDGTIRKLSSQIDVPENEGTRRKVVTESILAASRIIELRKILPFSWKFAEIFEGTLNKDLIEDVQSKINTIFSDNTKAIDAPKRLNELADKTQGFDTNHAALFKILASHPSALYFLKKYPSKDALSNLSSTLAAIKGEGHDEIKEELPGALARVYSRLKVLIEGENLSLSDFAEKFGPKEVDAVFKDLGTVLGFKDLVLWSGVASSTGDPADSLLNFVEMKWEGNTITITPKEHGGVILKLNTTPNCIGLCGSIHEILASTRGSIPTSTEDGMPTPYKELMKILKEKIEKADRRVERGYETLSNLEEKIRQEKEQITKTFTCLRKLIDEEENRLLEEMENLKDGIVLEEKLGNLSDEINNAKSYAEDIKKLEEGWSPLKNMAAFEKIRGTVIFSNGIEGKIADVRKIFSEDEDETAFFYTVFQSLEDSNEICRAQETVDEDSSTKKVNFIYRPALTEKILRRIREEALKTYSTSETMLKAISAWKVCSPREGTVSMNRRDATKISDGNNYTFIGSTPLPPSTVTSWRIKILNSRGNDGKYIRVGVAPSDIDQNEGCNYSKCGWYFGCYYSKLWSGPPHDYREKEYGPRKRKGEYVHTGDVVGVVMNTTKGELSFVLNGVDLGVAYKGIPLDKPLVPCVILRDKGDSVGFIA